MAGKLTRSQLLGGGVRGGVALLVSGTALGALADSAQASPPTTGWGTIASADLAYLRLLIGVELLMVDFWTEALVSKHLTGALHADANLALINESEHYNYLAAALTAGGGVPLTAANVAFTYPKTSFYSAASVLRLATTLEALALGSYLGAAGNIANPTLQAATAQITANEAQHFSVFATAAGRSGYREAFPDALTIEEASDALGEYTS